MRYIEEPGLPKTKVLFYRDPDGHSPVVEWLQELRRMDTIAYAKCAAVIERLAGAGHELRRPTADYLRDGIRELRAKKGRVNYRIPYFLHGKHVTVLAHPSRRRMSFRRPTSIEPCVARSRSRRPRTSTPIGSDPMAKATNKKSGDARRILDRITGTDAGLRRRIEEQKLNARIAEMILAARERAGLTQSQLAKLIGTTQSVVSRLEDAGYQGRSLTMLQRIAEALDHRLEVRLIRARA
jgi:ribosome-binding protein aMBF1 (putative translation factor)